MRGSRAILYERLSELASQLSELEDLRDLVEEAERSARGVPPLRLTHPPSRRLRSRNPGAMSVRLRRHAPLAGNAGAISLPDNDNQVDWTLLQPFPDGWWASS
jgi:hypothetical protein